jgi:hypothetical protein
MFFHFLKVVWCFECWQMKLRCRRGNLSVPSLASLLLLIAWGIAQVPKGLIRQGIKLRHWRFGKRGARLAPPPDKALDEVLQVKKAWLEAAEVANKPDSTARYKPVIYQTVPSA